MACEDCVVLGDYHGIQESELPDGRCDLSHLLIGVRAGVAGIGYQRTDVRKVILSILVCHFLLQRVVVKVRQRFIMQLKEP